MFFPVELFFASLLAFSPHECTLAASEHLFTFTSHDSVFQVGEELTYNVSYMHVDVGQVRIKVVDKVTQEGNTFYKTEAHIDSYRGVPFVDLHTLYESNVDSGMYALRFHSREKKGSAASDIVYRFDYSKHEVVILHGPAGKKVHDDTMRVNAFTQDGLSLFYFARTHLFTYRTLSVPTIVNEKKGSTLIKYMGERTSEKIDAVEYSIDLIHFEGNAGFVGVLGLSGDFEGWFSNDTARVPIIAKMKVVVGEVRIELMKWKRKGWVPPRSIGSEER